MTTESQPTDPVPVVPIVKRPGRALIGWMDPTAACAAAAGPGGDPMQPPFALRVDAARAAVAARSEGLDQTGLIDPDVPHEVLEHVRKLRASGLAESMFNDGWTVAMVDLTRVCGFQPNVYLDDEARGRVASVTSDPSTIAAVTLPLDPPTSLPVGYNEQSHAWTCASSNPNLRIMQATAAQADGGSTSFGFMVGVLPSFLQVAEYDGRHFLRDGYHRAVALLQLGVTAVPSFVLHVKTIEQLVPGQMLPQASYLGRRPPALVDYLDDEVSASVELPAAQKVIMIQAVEINVAA